MDYLSHCPILLDILEYVDYTDIPNCKLVNKMIDDFIQKNSLRMPRKEENMLIQWEAQGMGMLGAFMYSQKVFITEEFTVLFASRQPFLEYYRQNGIPFIPANSSSTDDIIAKIRVLHTFTEQDFASFVYYRNSSFEQGFRTLLSFLFQRYYYDFITIMNLPEEMQSMFLEEFRQGRSKCYRLYAPNMIGLHQLVRKLGCSTLQVSVPIPGENRNMMLEILEIVNWNLPIRLQLSYRVNYAKEFQNILQLLMDGELSLQKVELNLHCPCHRLAHLNDYSLSDSSSDNPTAQIVQQLISDAEGNWDEEKYQRKNGNFEKNISIERRSDSTVFCLKSSHLENLLLVISIKQL